MTFGKRLRLFMIGALLGVLLVIFFFNDRLYLFTSWLPNNRVLLRLQMTEADYRDVALCELSCFDLDTADVSVLKREGDVRFRDSQTQADPKVYVVDSRIDDRLVRMTFIAGDSISTLSRVELPYENVDCDCDDDEGI